MFSIDAAVGVGVAAVEAATVLVVGIVNMVEKRRSGKGKRVMMMMRVNSSPMMRWRLWRWLRLFCRCRRFLALLALVVSVLGRFSQSLS